MSESLTFVLSLGLLSSYCVALSNFNVKVFVLCYFILFCSAFWYLLETCSFLVRDRKVVDLYGKKDEKELEEIKEGEI